MKEKGERDTVRKSSVGGSKTWLTKDNYARCERLCERERQVKMGEGKRGGGEGEARRRDGTGERQYSILLEAWWSVVCENPGEAPD